MASRLLLIDNDAFILLAGSGMLFETIELLNIDVSQTRRLESLPHMLRKPAKSLKHLPPDVLQRALEDCDRIAALKETPDLEWSECFDDDCIGIDEGEVTLMGVAASSGHHLLASNDKRAMRALNKHPSLKKLRDALAGRMICMESIVRKLIEHHGADAAVEKIKAMAVIDKRLLTIVSPASSGRTEDCLEAVNSWLKGLRVDLGDDFLMEL